MVAFAGIFSPMIREVKEMMYEWEEPYLVEHNKYQETFGGSATPLEIAVKETVEWYRQQSFRP